MNNKVNRNDPCPCGSGKKYKKCCGQKETVSITAILEKEVSELQTHIIDYAVGGFAQDLEEDLREKIEDIETQDEKELEFFVFVHAIWFTLFVPFEDGRTILQRFIDSKGKTIQRPKLREILHSWTEARPIAGRMLSLSPEQMVVQDALTEEVLTIKLLEPVNTFDEVFVFGIIVPFGQDWVFFWDMFDLEGSSKQKEVDFLKQEFDLSGYEDPVEFLTDGFIELMNEVQFASFEYGTDDFEWAQASHKEVAKVYEDEMKKRQAYPSLISAGMVLWYKYCEEVPNQKRKAATNAAAIHFLNLSLHPMLKITKKEIADIYGVSVSSMSNAVNDMEEVLHEELMDLRTVLYDELLEMLEAQAQGYDVDDDDIFWDVNDEFLFDEDDEPDGEIPDKNIDDEDLPF